MTNEEQLKAIIAEALNKLGASCSANEVIVTPSKDLAHGDYACNSALKYSKILGKKPLELAEEIKSSISSELVDHIEIAGPGFINFFLKKESLSSIVKTILEQGDHFGDGKTKNQKIDVEFVSANPTGDLHLGHTRGAALGDSVCNILAKAGYEVTREYYLNNCGNQVEHLGHSVRARYHELFGEPLDLGDDDYHGVDLIKIAEGIKEQYGDKWLKDTKESHDFFIEHGIEVELGKIMKDLSDFGVHFDKISKESDIRAGSTIPDTIEFLKGKGYVYESEGATYLRTSDFLDDKDRPIIKKDGCYTYFLPDVCYHYEKMNRGFDQLIVMLGADHFGYINRMKSALMMKGYSPDAYEADIYQIVRVYKDGAEVKMSKRTGKAITHRELVAEVGKDAVRYFFAERNGDTHLDFDLDLATSHSKDNPVYYAQYAHARCTSLLEMGKDMVDDSVTPVLASAKEGDILKQLAQFPSMIEAAANARAPYKVANYIQKLAQLIHEYYAATKIIDRDDKASTASRLSLIKACRIVLRNALALLGVSAPDKM
ncbi:MAG: arginine--tRNA ligase [Bacilli bacterium]|nr:arginine--tRNA ligase [Bacilli bacterium]